MLALPAKSVTLLWFVVREFIFICFFEAYIFHNLFARLLNTGAAFAAHPAAHHAAHVLPTRRNFMRHFLCDLTALCRVLWRLICGTLMFVAIVLSLSLLMCMCVCVYIYINICALLYVICAIHCCVCIWGLFVCSRFHCHCNLYELFMGIMLHDKWARLSGQI